MAKCIFSIITITLQTGRFVRVFVFGVVQLIAIF